MTRKLSSQLRPTCAVCALAFSLAACDKSKGEQRQPPPPSPPAASATPTACAAGGGTIGDADVASYFPRQANGYCVDPHTETRSYGTGTPKPLDAICTEAFNGECEVYKSFGLQRVTIFRYVDGAGTPGSIEVVLSRYASAEGAYAMFTKRVVSDSDPARQGAPNDLQVPGAGALGTGSAYVWRGQLFVELTYSNEQQTPQQLAKTSAELLSSLGKQVTQKLPGPAALPEAAALLPQEHRVPLGISFEPADAFGVSGAGAGAYGYYREGTVRWRVVAVPRSDEEQAKDVLGSLLKREGAAKEKDIGDGAVRLMVGELAEGARAEWIVARKGSRVVGMGDESTVLRAGMSGAEREKLSLTREQKIKRLREMLAAAK
jgi:hypothetical protein